MRIWPSDARGESNSIWSNPQYHSNRPPTYRCHSTKASPSRHPSWPSCGQWPARTGCSSTRPRLPGCRSKLRRRRSPPGWRLSSGPVSPDDAAAARSGAPDVLVCTRGGYVAVDVKHHRSIDAGDAVLLTSTLAVSTPTAAALVAGRDSTSGRCHPGLRFPHGPQPR